MKKSVLCLRVFHTLLILPAVSGLTASAAPLYKVNNTDDLNLLTSWSTTSASQTPNPGALDPSDIWYFNELTMLGSKTVSLGGNLAIGGIGLDYATSNTANDLVINAGGTLTLNGATVYGNGVHAVGGSYTTAGIVLNRGLGGTLTINSDLAIGASQQWVNSRTLTVGGGINLNDKILSFNTAGSSVTTLSGIISGTGALNKSAGTGTLSLTGVANTFSGSVTGVGGNLSVVKLADTGSVSSIGTGAGSAGIILNGGTLTYNGTGDSTNRPIDMRAGAAVNNTGSGALTLNAPSVLQGGTASARTLTLGGTNSGNNTFSSILGNSGTGANISTLQKNGTGKWIVGGTQAYTGATIINQGTLRVGGSAVLGGDAAATGATTDIGNIWFSSVNASAVLEFEAAANLGPAAQIRFRNTGGTPGQGGALKYVGTTDQTVSKTIQCDTTIGIRLESDSVGGSVTFNGTLINNGNSRSLYLGGTGTGDNRLDIAFTGSGTLVKRDAGTWILGAANTYSGATTVNGGTLLVDGSTASAGLINVSSGATLGGAGSAGNTTLVDGAILSPGGGTDNSLALTSLSLGGASDLFFGLDNPLLPVWNDTVQVSGALTIAGFLHVSQQGGAAPGYDFTTAAPGTQWLLFTYASGQLTDGGLTVASAPALASGLSFAVDSTSTDGSVFLTVVPEAGTAGLVILGLLLIRRRRA